jgi:Skp family chaperone for outer membrane proteins
LNPTVPKPFPQATISKTFFSLVFQIVFFDFVFLPPHFLQQQLQKFCYFEEIDLEKTAQELDDKTGELKQLKSSSKKTAEEYAESEKARKELAEKLRNKSNGMCVIS